MINKGNDWSTRMVIVQQGWRLVERSSAPINSTRLIKSLRYDKVHAPIRFVNVIGLPPPPYPPPPYPVNASVNSHVTLARAQNLTGSVGSVVPQGDVFFRYNVEQGSSRGESLLLLIMFTRKAGARWAHTGVFTKTFQDV